jgi:hypothetical protein
MNAVWRSGLKGQESGWQARRCIGKALRRDAEGRLVARQRFAHGERTE